MIGRPSKVSSHSKTPTPSENEPRPAARAVRSAVYRSSRSTRGGSLDRRSAATARRARQVVRAELVIFPSPSRRGLAMHVHSNSSQSSANPVALVLRTSVERGRWRRDGATALSGRGDRGGSRGRARFPPRGVAPARAARVEHCRGGVVARRDRGRRGQGEDACPVRGRARRPRRPARRRRGRLARSCFAGQAGES